MRKAGLAVLLIVVTLALLTATQARHPAGSVDEAAPLIWEALAEGLEQTQLRPAGHLLSGVVVLRLDPAHYVPRVHYQPGAPLDLEAWRDALPEAAALINANFFDTEYRALGLLISDGLDYSRPFRVQSGVFLLDAVGGLHIAAGTWAVGHAEPVAQGVGSFPLLLQAGQAVYQRADDWRRSRRSAVAIDAQGRLLLLNVTGLGLTLSDFSRFLAEETRLGVVSALNLGGGGSSMLWADEGLRLPSFDAVPAVLALYPRD